MNPRLLILDDEPRMAEIVGMVLRRDGFEVETYTSSSDALTRHEQDPFDLVLTDLRMPAPDGLKVLRAVRALDSATPVILFTAHATIANAIEALRDGAFDYIQKPSTTKRCVPVYDAPLPSAAFPARTVICERNSDSDTHSVTSSLRVMR